MHSAPKSIFSVISLPLIAGVIATVFVWFYWGCLKNDLPLSYNGDSLQILAGIQGYQTGETGMFLPREFPRLNAPGEACWSDYPSEKILSWTAGQLSKILGLARGSNLTVLILQILAGCSFYLCGMKMLRARENHALLVACAILYGLAPYAFLRNLQHLTLVCYWQIPVFTLFLLWFGWPERVDLQDRGGLFLGIIAGLIGGFLNPYYLGPFLVILTLLALGKAAAREWRSMSVYAAAVGSSITGFVIQNLDHFIYAASHGRNHEALSRDLWWMVKFSLYLPDLFFPRAHQWEALSNLSWKIYHGHVPPQLWGESQTAYIGVVAGIGLILILLLGSAAVFARRFESISPYFWLSAALILFAVSGGVNYLLGSLGFQLLRAMDRASIMLACFALYFLCDQLPLWMSARLLNWVALLIVPLGIWDQIPKYPVWEEKIRRKGWEDFASDRVLFRNLEKSLGKGTMLFELPVKDFPEMGPVGDMEDYEHLRPVLHTDSLRISYGAVKGRGDTDWQKKCTGKQPVEMVRELQNRGFRALLINRKAYPDKAEDLRRQLEQAPLKTSMENDDFIVFELPSAR